MRVKRGPSHVHRRNRLLKRVKGFRWRRKSTIRLGRVAALKAGVHAYRHRRERKRDFRRLWNIQVNAGARLNGSTYGRLIHGLKLAHVELDRKILAHLAEHEPA
ncbi:MAG: 50S ribosomal protein L20, partial [Candidatus Giovannonibacteria bacterium GW2011_GWA2_53_7]